MGAQFRLEHANIMAYVTSRSGAAPRLLRQDLQEYLQVIAYNPREYLIPERHFEDWPDQISAAARGALELLGDASHETIAPAILSGQRVVIGAHGNSLRALVKYLDDVSEAEITELNIPTGIPLVYELDDRLKPLRHYYLGDPAAAAAAAARVAAQANAK